MRSKGAVVLSTIAILTTALWVTGLLSPLAAAGPLAKPHLAGGAPTVVSYQGQVMVGGSPYDGTGFFKFAVVDAAGTTTYWSNNATSTGGEEPTNGVSLIVTDGLFHVLLGDTSLTNMTQPLSAAVFDGTERYLRVWFSTDYITFQQLSPDRRITAVPYALQAQEAGDADTLDGEHASAFADGEHFHDPTDITPQGSGSGLDADRLDGQHGSYYQARVSGVCPVGSTVRAINADGTVVCQTDTPLNRIAAPTANISTTLDSAGDVGTCTSVTIGADGLGLISYYDVTNYDLKVAHCGSAFCVSNFRRR